MSSPSNVTKKRRYENASDDELIDPAPTITHVYFGNKLLSDLVFIYGTTHIHVHFGRFVNLAHENHQSMLIEHALPSRTFTIDQTVCTIDELDIFISKYYTKQNRKWEMFAGFGFERLERMMQLMSYFDVPDADFTACVKHVNRHCLPDYCSQRGFEIVPFVVMIDKYSEQINHLVLKHACDRYRDNINKYTGKFDWKKYLGGLSNKTLRLLTELGLDNIEPDEYQSDCDSEW
jgi:hypothetical protein